MSSPHASDDPRSLRLSAFDPQTGSPAVFLKELEAHARKRSGLEVGAPLGSGGMGEVLVARDRILERELALKRIRADEEDGDEGSLGAMRVRRFLEEAQVTAQLGHPGVVPVHELGIDPEGRLFFTMQRVEGVTLDRAFELAREGAEGWTHVRVVEVLIRVCEAVAYAHSRNVIHRDLKPANIMVGRFGETYVMDWGLAKARAEEVAPTAGETSPRHPRTDPDTSAWTTQEGSILGTPCYMPPEQAAGRTADLGPAADVYALGAILYHYLTGRRPYEDQVSRGSSFEVLERLAEHEPTPVLTLAPEASPELARVCEQTMARDPVHRPQDLLEVAAALRAHFDQPVRRARVLLAGSRPLRALEWLVTLLLIGAVLGLAGSVLLVALGDGKARGSLAFPIELVKAPPAEFRGSVGPFEEFALSNVRADLEGTTIGFPWYLALPLSGGLALLMLGLWTARRLIRSLRRGEPFSEANVRRMRMLGVLVLLFGVGQVALGAIGRTLGEQLTSSSYTPGGSYVSIPWGALTLAGMFFVLAEAFRVGVALERRD
jgi:hypothetical protein